MSAKKNSEKRKVLALVMNEDFDDDVYHVDDDKTV